MASASVDCVVTSPPYFLLRDYNVVGQLGLEDTVEEWVRRMRAVMAEVARVLVPTGSCWLNLGDSYSRHAKYGAPPKSLLMAPERLALASDRGRLDPAQSGDVAQDQPDAGVGRRSSLQLVGRRLLPHPLTEIPLRP